MNIQSSFTVYTAALHALILILFSLHTSGLGYPGLTCIYCILTNKTFSSPKTSSRTPYSNNKQQEKQKHSAKNTINFSPDWGAHGGNEYWRNLLDRLTISSVRLPDEAIYVPLGRKTPIGKPGWGSMLSVVDEGLTSIPWEDLDPTLVQAIQRESDGLALGDL